MPAYEYGCATCGGRATTFSTIASYDPDARVDCIECRTPMRRVYEPLPFQMGMDGHYNPTVGRYVSGKRDFEDGLKAASEEASKRNGIEHNYKPIDLRDVETVGATGEGLGATARRRHHEGKPMPVLPVTPE